jgi:hypothetical protein
MGKTTQIWFSDLRRLWAGLLSGDHRDRVSNEDRSPVKING